MRLTATDHHGNEASVLRTVHVGTPADSDDGPDDDDDDVGLPNAPGPVAADDALEAGGCRVDGRSAPPTLALLLLAAIVRRRIWL